MTKINLYGKPVNTRGSLPDIGSLAHDFNMVKTDLSEVNLYSFKEKHILLNIFPSIDTDVCSKSVREFNKEAADLVDVLIINLSMDLPFAHKRFCTNEGIKNTQSCSLFRSDFFKYYQLDFIDGPLKGLCSRVVMILNQKHELVYVEEVLEVSDEPNYLEALRALST